MSDIAIDEDAIIARAVDLQNQVEALYEEQDKVLQPLAKAMVSQINAWVKPVPIDVAQKMVDRINRLPRGFYRSELRTLVLEKSGR